jgi:peroxiredoxin
MPTTAGPAFRMSDHAGKQVILMAFFATWSGPATTALQHFEQLHKEKQSDGLLVLGVAVDGPDTLADVPSYVSRNGFTFPIAIDQDSHVTARFNPRRAVPLFVLIDRQTHVSVLRDGYNPGDEVGIRQAVETALSH